MTTHICTSSSMLFNEEACFSKRVPKETIQTWLIHGGRIYSREKDAVASYFFAVNQDDEWTSILCRRSVVVIHAGWILHCIAHSFRLPVAGYVLDDGSHLLSPADGFDARLTFSQDDNINNCVPTNFTRPQQRVSWPSQPPSLLCIPPNAPQKRKRQRDSTNYSSAWYSDSGDSPPRPPRKRRMLSSKVSSATAERPSDGAIAEAHDFTTDKHNIRDPSPTVITTNIRLTNNHASPASHCLALPFKATSKPHHSTIPGKDQGHEKVVKLDSAFDRSLAYPLVVTGTSLSTCLGDSPPVPAIDFTRMQFPSRNRWRFPLMLLEPAATTDAKGKEGEDAACKVSSNYTPVRMIAHDVPSATHFSGISESAMTRATGSLNDGDQATGLLFKYQGKQVKSPGSLRCLSQENVSRSDIVTYCMDQLIRKRERAPGREDIQFATQWENNAIWKGMRFWHETLRKRRGRERLPDGMG